MDWSKLLSSDRLRKSSPTDIRNAYESDYGRIIYSPAFRRMHDKTQVFPLTTDDNIHSRLTHSTEVMSIGYTFGIKLSRSEKFQKITGKDELTLLRIIPILIQNICLIHDIGNSPFGHFGEEIMANYFKNLKNKAFDSLSDRQKRDFTFYDGNAQGLRVLTKLQILNDPYGLNLTFSTLAASLKYPNFSITNAEKEAPPYYIEQKKHGIFFSEEIYYNKISEAVGMWHPSDNRVIRHPLTYLMEAADSIAYLCMDMEDGFNKGVFSFKDIENKFDNDDIEICRKIKNIISDNSALDVSYKIVQIRINLIQYFVNLAFENFENNLDNIEKGEYNKELIKDDPDKISKIVEGFSGEIFKSREVNSLEITGYSVITGLLNFYVEFLFNENKKLFKRAKSLISNSIIFAAIEEI